MKSLLKNLGLVVILAGVIILIVCAFTGNVNNNAVLATSSILIIVGLVGYIVLNKYITD